MALVEIPRRNARDDHILDLLELGFALGREKRPGIDHFLVCEDVRAGIVNVTDRDGDVIRGDLPGSVDGLCDGCWGSLRCSEVFGHYANLKSSMRGMGLFPCEEAPDKL